ncbi:MAG: type II secretion system protein [Candidatus Gastranaerophilales bacterium]|nr:type II secretion system protein [Candidatus Gastranaerophilales bacterium]
MVNKHFKTKAFTLAEVLITLTIIGIVAAMTIPSLMYSTNKQEYRTALKKSLTVLNQAITANYALDGMTMADYDTASDLVENMFKQRMSITTTKTDGPAYHDGATAVAYTVDGMSFGVIGDKQASCQSQLNNPCFELIVDINGDKKPNQLTLSGDDPKDGYKITLYPYKAVPTNEVTQRVLYDQGIYYN